MAATFNYTGAAQSWVVPAGITVVTVECWGAQGAQNPSGLGGYSKGLLAVTPGETLNVYVGGTAGWNGGGAGGGSGGSGGGASDVRQGGTALANRKIVAGGGGGSMSSVDVGPGGGGGGTTGYNGSYTPFLQGSGGGFGGTQTAGGASGGSAGAGTLGAGGGGGSNSGGGGGGYYGGGGGASQAGGGGGSGYIGGVTSGITSSNTRSGDGLVVITFNVAPNAPALTSPATNATIDRGIVQRFAWTFSDPDVGDSQSKFDLQYRLIGAPTWTTVSGTTPNTFYDFAAGTFALGNYEWQVRTYDALGTQGPFSSSSFFTAGDAPPQPTITAPTSGATVQNMATLTWSAPNQTDYEWRRVADNAGAANTGVVYADSGDVVNSNTRTLPDGLTFDTNNRYEHIQVRIKYGGVWSSWADVRVYVSWTPPPTPTVTLTPDNAAATMTLGIVNPAPTGNQSTASYNDVYCRTAASSTVLDTYRPYSATGTRIGTALATNTPFIDRTPAGSPVVYEYRVVSVASNQTTSDSGWQATP